MECNITECPWNLGFECIIEQDYEHDKCESLVCNGYSIHKDCPRMKSILKKVRKENETDSI